MATDFDGLSSDHVSTAGHARRDNLISLGISRNAIRSAAATERWTNPHRGVYRLSQDDSPHAALWAAYLHLGPDSTLVLSSAAEVHGIQGIVGRVATELAVPPGLEKAQRAGMNLHVWAIPDDQRVVVDGLPVTTVARTLADCARLLPRMQAVSCLDSALHLGMITPESIPDLRALMVRKRHCVSGRRRLLEVRVGAQSPLETRVRLRASDGGFEPDELQVPIRSESSVLLGYGDMGYELADGAWLIVEADGLKYHDKQEALLHDRRRQNAFLNERVASILRFTWEDTTDSVYIPKVLGAALAKGGWRANPRRP